jgi:hypothetical protein
MALSTAALTSALALLIGMRRMFMELAFDTVGHVTVEREGYRERAAMLPVHLAIDDPTPLLATLRARPDVAGATVELVCGARLLSGERSAEAMVRGIDVGDEAWNRRYRQAIVDGAFPASDGSVVLGGGLARYLGLSVGDRLTLLAYNPSGGLNAVSVVVAGIYRPTAGGVWRAPRHRAASAVRSSATAVWYPGCRRHGAGGDRARGVAGDPAPRRALLARRLRRDRGRARLGEHRDRRAVLDHRRRGRLGNREHAPDRGLRAPAPSGPCARSACRGGISDVVVAETGLTGLIGSILGWPGRVRRRPGGARGIDMGPQLDESPGDPPAFTAESASSAGDPVCVSALPSTRPGWPGR